MPVISADLAQFAKTVRDVFPSLVDPKPGFGKSTFNDNSERNLF